MCVSTSWTVKCLHTSCTEKCAVFFNKVYSSKHIRAGRDTWGPKLSLLCSSFVWKRPHCGCRWWCVSQRNVGVFLPGIQLLLACQHLQVSADPLAGGRRLDDVIHKPWNTQVGLSEKEARCASLLFFNATKEAATSESSRERVGELLHVFGLCFRLVLLPSENDLHGPLRERQETGRALALAITQSASPSRKPAAPF